MSKKFLILFFDSFSIDVCSNSLLKDFPEGYTLEEIGKRIAYRFSTEKTCASCW